MGADAWLLFATDQFHILAEFVDFVESDQCGCESGYLQGCMEDVPTREDRPARCLQKGT